MTNMRHTWLVRLPLVLGIWACGWWLAPTVGVTSLGTWLLPHDTAGGIVVGAVACGLLLAVLLITQRPLNQEFLRQHWSMYLLIPAVLLLSIVPLRVGGLFATIDEIPAWAYVLMTTVHVFMQQYLTFGLLQSWLQRWFPPFLAVVGTGTLFYVIHAILMPYKFAPVHWTAALAILAMGVTCAALRYKMSTIYFTLALHLFFYAAVLA